MCPLSGRTRAQYRYVFVCMAVFVYVALSMCVSVCVCVRAEGKQSTLGALLPGAIDLFTCARLTDSH